MQGIEGLGEHLGAHAAHGEQDVLHGASLVRMVMRPRKRAVLDPVYASLRAIPLHRVP
jgi:hypothetical protein